jgi:hypothetical protein
MLKPKIYSMDYDELNEHIGHTIVCNDVWDWQTNRQTGIEIRCLDCDTEPLFEAVAIPNGGGERISRERAIEMLKTKTIPEDCYLMSYEYGKDNINIVDEETEETDEEYWTGLEYDDLETIEEDEEYQNFELWSKQS